MKRSTGVTAAAIVLVAGSGIGLLLTSLGIFALALGSRVQPQSVLPPQLLVLVILFNIFFICLEAFGIFTGIGLLRLKNWARITTIVFAVCILLQSMFSTLIVLVMPLPTDSNVPANFNLIFRGIMTGFGLFFLAIGAWWLVLFTRRGVSAQFQPVLSPAPMEFAEPALQPLPPRAGRVPVVVLVVAILLLAGTPSMLVVPFMHFPAFFLGKVLYGGAARIFFVVIFVADLTVGIGLLRLKRWSLPAAIAFYVFNLLNSIPMFFPAVRDAYFAAVFRSMPFPMPPEAIQFSPHMLAYSMDFGLAFGVLFCAVLPVLLIRSRPAFEQAARERASANS